MSIFSEIAGVQHTTLHRPCPRKKRTRWVANGSGLSSWPTRVLPHRAAHTLGAQIYAGGRFIAEDGPDPNYSTATASMLRVTDHVGSLRGLLDLGQHVVEGCKSFPFGDGFNCTSSADNMLFSSKPRDSESSLDNFGARYYSSVLGRFVSPDWSAGEDPVPYARLSDPQSLNLYAYAGNNPATDMDIDGHAILGRAIGQCNANAAGNGCSEYADDRYELFGPGTSAQQQTANAASSQAGSMKYSINGTTISGGGVTYGKGTNKCNEFACDAVQSGTGYRPQVPKSGILGWLGFTRDPTAKEWATMAIPGYSGPLPLSAARPGDVIAMGHHDDPEGHVGIYVGNGMTASANAHEGGRITVNNWGFRGPGQNGEHPGDAGPVVRQWVGLP